MPPFLFGVGFCNPTTLWLRFWVTLAWLPIIFLSWPNGLATCKFPLRMQWPRGSFLRTKSDLFCQKVHVTKKNAFKITKFNGVKISPYVSLKQGCFLTLLTKLGAGTQREIKWNRIKGPATLILYPVLFGLPNTPIFSKIYYWSHWGSRWAQEPTHMGLYCKMGPQPQRE